MCPKCGFALHSCWDRVVLEFVRGWWIIIDDIVMVEGVLCLSLWGSCYTCELPAPRQSIFCCLYRSKGWLNLWRVDATIVTETTRFVTGIFSCSEFCMLVCFVQQIQPGCLNGSAPFWHIVPLRGSHVQCYFKYRLCTLHIYFVM